MRKKIGTAALAVLLSAVIIGCDGGVFMGSKAVGVRSGEFVHSAGYVASTYKGSLDRVWQAAEAVMKDMKAIDVVKEKKIAQGTIRGLIMEEKVVIKVEYHEWESTSVSVLVGMGGSRIAARYIHEKITEKLTATP